MPYLFTSTKPQKNLISKIAVNKTFPSPNFLSFIMKRAVSYSKNNIKNAKQFKRII